MTQSPQCPWPSSQCDGGCRVCRGEAAAPDDDGPHRQVSLGQLLVELAKHVVQMPLAARDERMREEGREEMRRRHDILTPEESEKLVEILKNPPAPSPLLVEAMRRLKDVDPVRQTWVKALNWAAQTCWMTSEDIQYAASVSSLPGASERVFALHEMTRTLRKKAVDIEGGADLP